MGDGLERLGLFDGRIRAGDFLFGAPQMHQHELDVEGQDAPRLTEDGYGIAMVWRRHFHGSKNAVRRRWLHRREGAQAAQP
jgi:hypothetical protein